MILLELNDDKRQKGQNLTSKQKGFQFFLGFSLSLFYADLPDAASFIDFQLGICSDLSNNSCCKPTISAFIAIILIFLASLIKVEICVFVKYRSNRSIYG